MQAHPGEIPVERSVALGIDPGIPGFASFPWLTLPDSLNVADFQLVVLDLSSLTSLGPAEKSRALRIVTKARVGRLLSGPRTELLVLGEDPSFLRDRLPTPVSATADGGTNITNVHAEVASYFEFVDEYRWITGSPGHARASYEVLAKAAGRDTVAQAVWWDGSGSNMIWLPEANEREAAIAALLRERYGLHGGPTPPPPWANTIELPAMPPLRESLGAIEERIEELERERDQLAHELADASRLVGILYETGEELEVLVREALGVLGAEVAAPTEDDQHDGTLSTPDGASVVLEIKGRTGAIRVADVRQLDDWRTQLSFPNDEGEPAPWKGLLVATAFRELPPSDRDELFGPNAIRLAREKGLVLISTNEVFEALVSNERGEFDSLEWWRGVMARASSAGGN